MKPLLITILIFVIPTSIIAKPPKHGAKPSKHDELLEVVTTHASESTTSLAEIQSKLLHLDQKLNELLERPPSENHEVMARSISDRAAEGGSVVDLTQFSTNEALRLQVIRDVFESFEQLALLRHAAESGEPLGQSTNFDQALAALLLDSGVIGEFLQIAETPPPSPDNDFRFELIRGYNLYVRVTQLLRQVYVITDSTQPD